jgi:hypothetical protein
MKLQLQEGSLRLRIDERELAGLLAGHALELAVRAQREPFLHLTVVLAPSLSLVREGDHWRLQLPDAALHAYAKTLPRRDALSLALSEDLGIDFEVDVRDSIRQRGARRRAEPPPPEK